MGRNKKQHPKKQNKATAAPAEPSGPSMEDLVGYLEKLGVTEPRERIRQMKTMEPNQRFNLSQQYPDTFGRADKLVAHRIETLTVDSTKIRINHMIYHFQTRSYFPGKTDPHAVEGNADKYGNLINQKVPRHQNLEGGDILIERPDGDPKKGFHPPDQTTMVPVRQIQERASRDLRINEGLLLEFPRKVDLTACLRNFIANFLAGPRVHHVKDFTVEMDEGILRFPKELQLKVQRLSLMVGNTDRVLKGIEPVIHVSSYPIEWLTLQVESPEDPIWKNKIIGPKFSAVDLCLPNLPGATWSEAACQFEHPHFHLSKNELKIVDWLTIIQDWIVKPRPLGHKFSMTTSQYELLADSLVVQFNGKKTPVQEFVGGPRSVGVAVPVTGTELVLLASKEQFDTNPAPGVFGKLDKIVVEVMKKL